MAGAKRGRPTIWTQDLEDEVLVRLTTASMVRVCEDPEMPARRTLFRWMAEDPAQRDGEDMFRHRYAAACAERAERMLEETMDIADDPSHDFEERFDPESETLKTAVDREAIQRSRLRVDTRKWYLAKCWPEKYGDRLNLGGVPGQPVQVTKVDLPDEVADAVRAAAENYVREGDA